MNDDLQKSVLTFEKNATEMAENKIRQYHLRVKRPRNCSVMDVIAGPVSISFFVANDSGTRNRRQLLLTLYQAMEPHLDFIVRSTIHHLHHVPPYIFNKDEFSELSVKQGIHVVDNKTQLGYFIRGIRTKLQKTQKEFAKELGVGANYLSLIERGNRTASPKLLRKIYEYDEKKSVDGLSR